MIASDGVNGGCMSAKLDAICASVRRPGRTSASLALGFSGPMLALDRFRRAQLDLLLHRVVVGRERRPVDVFAGAALHPQLALGVDQLAAAHRVRGAAL